MDGCCGTGREQGGGRADERKPSLDPACTGCFHGVGSQPTGPCPLGATPTRDGVRFNTGQSRRADRWNAQLRLLQPWQSRWADFENAQLRICQFVERSMGARWLLQHSTIPCSCAQRHARLHWRADLIACVRSWRRSLRACFGRYAGHDHWAWRGGRISRCACHLPPMHTACGTRMAWHTLELVPFRDLS